MFDVCISACWLLESYSDSSSTLPITIPNDKVIRAASPVTFPDNTPSTSDNTNSHHQKRHILSSNIISSASAVPIYLSSITCL